MSGKPTPWVRLMRDKAEQICLEQGSVYREDLRDYEAELASQGIYRPNDRAYQNVFLDRRFKFSRHKLGPGNCRYNVYVLDGEDVSWFGIPPFNARCRTAGRYNV